MNEATKTEKQGRGELTTNVKEKSLALLGYKITVRELRLMPYIQHCMVNTQKIDPNKVNFEERKILSKWRKEGHIAGGAGGMGITKEFWDIINEIIFIAYVDID